MVGDTKSIIYDIENQLRWYVCKSGGLGDF